jgi:hypothetical protein
VCHSTAVTPIFLKLSSAKLRLFFHLDPTFTENDYSSIGNKRKHKTHAELSSLIHETSSIQTKTLEIEISRICLRDNCYLQVHYNLFMELDRAQGESDYLPNTRKFVQLETGKALKRET